MATIRNPDSTYLDLVTSILAGHRQANPRQQMVPYENETTVTTVGFGFAPEGVHTISGVLTMANGGIPQVAILIDEQTGGVLKSQTIPPTAEYEFTDIPAGKYAIAVIDTTGTYRGKVIHTVVYDDLAFSKSTLDVVVSGVAYSDGLTLANAEGAVTWELTGTLPAGLTFDGTEIVGTTTTASALWPITITATDSVGRTASVTLNLQVAADSYATWGNYDIREGDATRTALSNGNRTVTNTSVVTNTPSGRLLDRILPYGKLYGEIKLDVIASSGSENCVGLFWVTKFQSHTNANSRLYIMTAGVGSNWIVKNASGTLLNTGIAAASGDVIGIAINTATGNVWFRINGTWVQGDPVAGTLPFTSNGLGAGANIFWQTNNGAVGSKATIYAGDLAFAHSVPSGYRAGFYHEALAPLLFHPAWGDGFLTYQNGRRDIYNNQLVRHSAHTDLPRNSGKRYFELVNVDGVNDFGGGIARHMSALNSGTETDIFDADTGSDIFSWGVLPSGNKYFNNGQSACLASLTAASTVLNVAVDLDAGKIWFGRNHVFVGNPAAGTGEAFSFTPGCFVEPAATGSYQKIVRINGKRSEMLGTIPAGFLPWSDRTAVAAALPTLANSDDFSTNTISSYTVTQDSGTPTWTVTGGKMVGVSAAQSACCRNGFSQADVAVECDTNFSNDGGLLLRFANQSNFYLMTLSDDSGVNGTANVRIYKRVGGTFTQLGASVDLAWARGTTKTMRFSANGTNLIAYVDGVAVVDVIDTSLSAAGSVGMRSNSASGDEFLALRWG